MVSASLLLSSALVAFFVEASASGVDSRTSTITDSAMLEQRTAPPQRSGFEGDATFTVNRYCPTSLVKGKTEKIVGFTPTEASRLINPDTDPCFLKNLCMAKQTWHGWTLKYYYTKTRQLDFWVITTDMVSITLGLIGGGEQEFECPVAPGICKPVGTADCKPVCPDKPHGKC